MTSVPPAISLSRITTVPATSSMSPWEVSLRTASENRMPAWSAKESRKNKLNSRWEFKSSGIGKNFHIPRYDNYFLILRFSQGQAPSSRLLLEIGSKYARREHGFPNGKPSPHPEPVSHAADCFDQRAIRIGFDPLAEFGDVLIQGARFWEVVQSPAFVENRIAIDHLTGAFVE